MNEASVKFDVVVIGAGPAGATAAIAQAQRGRSVLLLEANPNAADRLAGEWLHPRAVRVLSALGVELDASASPSDGTVGGFDSGRGFVVHPDDGSEPVVLPYGKAGRGWSGEHRALVDRLRTAARAYPNVSYRCGARVTAIAGQRVTIRSADVACEQQVDAALVIGADGRTSVARRALGLAPETSTVSRMAGLRLASVELPRPGFGHVFLGGPGPILAYRITHDHVRLCVDVPPGVSTDPATLHEAYACALPEDMRAAFRHALSNGQIQWAANQTRLRRSLGRPGLVLIGDAAGFQHPLTALGMTMGILDALELAEQDDFEAWRSARRSSARVPELLASVLYDVFKSGADTAQGIREGMFQTWRKRSDERNRTMQYLAAEESRRWEFARSFARIAGPALVSLAGVALRRGDLRGGTAKLREFSRWGFWLARSMRSDAQPDPPAFRNEPQLRASGVDAAVNAGPAIERAVRGLVELQGVAPGTPPTGEAAAELEGGFEGEVIWCAMLAAQYVLFCEVMGIEIAEERRARLLLQFETTRRDDGLWGLHPLSPPYLFTTTLVYVAARLLGEPASSPLLSRAGRFIAEEDVTYIPTWGKLWLALVGLFDWRGVPPIVPELWALPESWPVHPSKFYCHTRHIYVGMSVLHARRPRAPETARLAQLRRELHPGGFERVNWTRARRNLRKEELETPPGRTLRLAYEFGTLFDRFHRPALRARVLTRLDHLIRWELDASDHTCLSPVSGMLGMLALQASPRPEPDLKRGIERLEAWIFEDDTEGMRIAGARSATWDTSFALQALAASAPHADVHDAVARGRDFLLDQQVKITPAGFEAAYRLDPRGGFCFAHGWHGWPVSDCTAEAMEAIVASRRIGIEPSAGQGRTDDAHALQEAARFLLRCQNRDGGFGSYEAQRSRVELEWLNPAEMFGDSMTEHSYVECTASCLSALSKLPHGVDVALAVEVDRAMGRAERRLRSLQRPDGAWVGVWGVHLIYGTCFGVRGLVAAGVSNRGGAILRACEWLLERQHADGGWGESHEGCSDGVFVDTPESHVTQTAWALLALLEARCTDWESIARGAEYLMDALPETGRWPRGAPVGLFFRTALLEYDLYRQVFPLWALALYETRRREREQEE